MIDAEFLTDLGIMISMLFLMLKMFWLDLKVDRLEAENEHQ